MYLIALSLYRLKQDNRTTSCELIQTNTSQNGAATKLIGTKTERSDENGGSDAQQWVFFLKKNTKHMTNVPI